MSNQSAERLSTEKKGQTLLKAGQMVLMSTKPYSLLQEVADDDQFAPLQNITTTYVDHEGTSVEPLFVPSSSHPKSTLNSRASMAREKTANELEYLKITSQIKNNHKAAARSLARRKQEKQKAFFQEQEEELAGVQEIIGEIQSIMNSTADGQALIRIKPSVQVSSRIKKANWQSKPVKSFSQNDGFSKLQELLLNYKIDEQKITNGALQAQEKPPAKGQRKQRRQERLKRNEKYREITAAISGTEQKEAKRLQQTKGQGDNNVSVEKADQSALSDQPKQSLQRQERSQQQSVRVQDIEIVELDWAKLPVFLCPFTQQNAQILLRMREYPDDPAFLEAISEILGKETTYEGYSIFAQNRNAGIAGSDLVSEEEFREKWAEEWNHEVEDEENKDLLCEWDFQWYRSLVQLTYSHSLEEILMKSIKYDPQLYLSNLKKLHGVTNDKNKAHDMKIQQRIVFNRFKFVESLLTKFNQERVARTNRKCVILGVIPTMQERNSQDQSELIKQYVQQMFVGGLYSQQKGVSMAVLATLSQAKAARIVREGEGAVRVGEVDLLMKGGSSKRTGPKIVLKQERKKNSWVWIGVLIEGRQEMVLEVGQQLHFGRRYRIDLD